MRPAGPGGEGSHPDIALLAQTDELLDRIGQRSPTLPDLDDAVLASLAVLAADVDLDEVPLQRTRRALGQHGLWPPRMDATRTLHPWGDDLAVLAPLPDPAEFGRSPSPPITPDTVELPVQRGQEAGTESGSEPGADTAAETPWTPPAPRTRAEALAAEAGRDLDRRGPRSGREPGREVSLHVLPVLGAAGAALVLSMGAAAALTSGQSVNPAKALSDMVSRINDGGSTGPSSSGSHGIDPSFQDTSEQRVGPVDPGSSDEGAPSAPSGPAGASKMLAPWASPSGMPRLASLGSARGEVSAPSRPAGTEGAAVSGADTTTMAESDGPTTSTTITTSTITTSTITTTTITTTTTTTSAATGSPNRHGAKQHVPPGHDRVDPPGRGKGKGHLSGPEPTSAPATPNSAPGPGSRHADPAASQAPEAPVG